MPDVGVDVAALLDFEDDDWCVEVDVELDF